LEAVIVKQPTETYRYVPDPGLRRGMLALINSPELLSEHESPRKLAKKVFIARMGRRVSELVKTISDDNQLFTAGLIHPRSRAKTILAVRTAKTRTRSSASMVMASALSLTSASLRKRHE